MTAASVSVAQVPYFSDFETDGGGWIGTGDWERGVGSGFVGGFGRTEPTGGFSGDFVWGTVIGGDHSAGLVSTLTQNFDFSGAAEAELSFMSGATQAATRLIWQASSSMAMKSTSAMEIPLMPGDS